MPSAWSSTCAAVWRARTTIYERIFITHTPVSKEVLDTVWRTVEQYGKFEHTYETNAGCTVSCHCGEGCLGVLYIHKNPKVLK